MNDPALYVAYFDGGWLDLAFHVASVVLALVPWFLWYRERMIRKTWEPIIRAIQRAVENRREP